MAFKFLFYIKVYGYTRILLKLTHVFVLCIDLPKYIWLMVEHRRDRYCNDSPNPNQVEYNMSIIDYET